MSKHEIPYEATVEASRAIDDDVYVLLGWEGITRLLEAAAPRMLAEAWDDALQHADDQGYLYGHQSDLLKLDNPYRTAS